MKKQLDIIVDIVCNYMHLDYAKLRSRCRTLQYADARHLICYIAKDYGIYERVYAEKFDRTPASFHHSCITCKSLLSIDKKYKRDYDNIKKSVTFAMEKQSYS